MAKQRVRLTFTSDSIAEPIIYTLGQQFNIVTNIYQADLNEERGWAILELVGKDDDIEAGITWAISKGVRVEPLGQ